MKFVDAALGAALWLNNSKLCSPGDGCHWPMNSTDGAPQNYPFLSESLYYGTPGSSLFFATLARAVGDDRWRAVAEEALDHTVARLNDTVKAFGPNPGFYYGLLGIAYGLRAANTSARHRTAAASIEMHVLSTVEPFATASSSTTLWNNTDVAHGVAGAGLYLLWAAHNGADVTQIIQPLVRAADWLLDVAEATPDGGLRWYRGVDTDGVHAGQYFPTFCCGGAGVSFFLATLADALPQLGGGEAASTRFLDAAKRGAAHAMAEAYWIHGTAVEEEFTVANSNSSNELADSSAALLLPHAEEGAGRKLYYLGWCGGPPGWARLFVALWHATADAQWLDRLTAAVRATALLVPSQLNMIFPPTLGRAPWANLGQCCGASAAGTFLLRVATSSLPLPEEVRHVAMDAARAIGQRIVHHAVPAGPASGLAFPSAEEHAAPANTTWQTGWMQGAAGVAAFLLHLDAVESHGRGNRPLWPDEPLW